MYSLLKWSKKEKVQVSFVLTNQPTSSIASAVYEGRVEYSCKYFTERKQRQRLSGKGDGPLVRWSILAPGGRGGEEEEEGE